MEIRYTKQAFKYLDKLHKPKREQIRAAISKIPEGNIIKMKGREDIYRLRVNDYRVLFSIENDIIYVHKVKSRGDIYYGN